MKRWTRSPRAPARLSRWINFVHAALHNWSQRARRLHETCLALSRVQRRRPVLLGLESLEARELLDANSALVGGLTQLRNDVATSAVALVNAVQPLPTNTSAPASVMSQWNKAWTMLATDWRQTVAAAVQVEYAALQAVEQEIESLLNDLGIRLTGQPSSATPPATSSSDASPSVAGKAPNAVPTGSNGTVGDDSGSGGRNVTVNAGVLEPLQEQDPNESTYTTPGTTTWTAPAGVTQVTVQAWGGGGGGNGSGAGGGGWGGGGGGWSQVQVNVTAGTNYTVVVGAGGAGATLEAHDGGQSSFAFGSTVYASANGGGGSSGSAGVGGTGNGTTSHTGGNGGTASSFTNGSGGGGAAGSMADGGIGGNGASGGAGGVGGNGGGGNGGDAGNGFGTSGANGDSPGGGGGGGVLNSDGSLGGSGGNGGDGEVIISWASNTLPLPPVTEPGNNLCNCGCLDESGSMMQSASSQNALTATPNYIIAQPSPSPGTFSGTASTNYIIAHTPLMMTPYPVRYADGVVTIAETDLHSDGFGFPWGQTRSWTNGPGYATGSDNGNGWVDTYIPHLIEADGSTNTLIFIANGNTAYYYDLVNGVYQPRLNDGSTLTYDSVSDTYTLIDTSGNTIVLDGFGSSWLAAQQGQFASFTGPNGTQMAVTSYTSDGHIAEMQRSATSGSDTTTESWLYNYLPDTDANAGLLSGVTERTQVNGGAWSTVRQVQYAYYDGSQNSGSLGDLMTATVLDGSDNVLDTSYYRYYTQADIDNGEAGYVGGLKYVFNPDSYDRLTAALGTNLSSLTDAQVAPYADNYFQYDSQQRVTQETAQGAGDSQTSGGLGTYTFRYTASDNTAGSNSWSTKTVVTNPDGSTDTVYTNAYAEVMLDDHYDPSSGLHTNHFYAYNDQGQLVLNAAPTAVSGYDDTYADLLNNQSGSYQYLNNSSGLIARYDYYTTTTADDTTAAGVANYLEDIEIQQGQSGTLIPQETWQYYAHAYNGQTIAPIATDTVYRNDDGTGAETTSSSYTWYTGTAQIQSETDTAPGISAAQNGPGTSDVTTTYFDEYGNVQWLKDPDGYIQYFAYDPVTGALMKAITDVDTTQTSEFTNLPTGWSTPSGGGLNLVTTAQIDALGRVTEETSPGGNITYYVYLDAQHEERIYQGWNSSTGTPTGPTEVIRHDASDGYDEVFTMTATPHLTDGTPDGTEAISGLQTLTRDYTNAAGQVTAEDAYFNLGGLAYTTGAMGALNVNYYETDYGYDSDGRLVRTQTPNGTIYRTVYNSLGEEVSAWVGTNDTPASGEWSPSNNTGSANMVMVSSYQYDNGGVGDGNLTQETDYPGLGAANRVTDYWYDWRDRQVAAKSGVQGTETDGVNRPIIVTTYDNLDEAIETQQYAGDGVTPQIVNGVLQTLDPSLLRAQEIDSYDDQGRLYQTQVYDVNPSTGAVSSSALTTNYYYDHRGDVMAESDPGGLWTKSQYDGAGRDVMDYATDGASGTTWADADSVTNDTVLEQEQTVYDGDSNPIETIDSQRFDNATGTGPLGSPTSGIGARVYYAAAYYDNADRLVASVDAGTNGGTAWTRPDSVPASSLTLLVTQYVYSAAGWLQDSIDPMGLDDRTLYDNLGRTTETIQDYTDGTETADSNIATEYGYDGNGNTLYVRADEPDGSYQQTNYVYGVTTTGGSGVNSNDIPSAIEHPDPTTGDPSSSQQDSYLVNALGQTVQSTDRNGNVHQYSYDVLGRLASDAATTLGTGVDGSVRRIDYAYDSQGNLSLITSYDAPTGGNIVNQVMRQFNGLGQLTAEYEGHHGAVDTSQNGTVQTSIQYAYNEMANGENNSRLVSITYPSTYANARYTLSYNYAAGLDDRISRLSSLSDNSPLSGSYLLESYKYLGLDTVVERDHPQTNVNQTYLSQNGQTGDAGDQYVGLDRFGRVVNDNWVNAKTGQSTDDFAYGYNPDGDVLYKQNLVDTAMSELYQYNNLHELVNFQRGTLNATQDGIVGTPSRSQSWSPDALGNFDSETSDGSTQTRTANQQNEITSISGSGTVTYDANGNLTADGSGNTYVYDAWNHLVAVQNAGTTVANYGYDGLGRRITETHGSDVRELYYSADGQVLTEWYDGLEQARNVWSPVYVNALVVHDQASEYNGVLNQRLLVQQDANWNVTALVNQSDTVVERYDYDPYGVQTVLNADFSVRGTSILNVPYGFQGMRSDALVSLDFADNRVYDPALMRWLQTDPIGLNAGNNDYEFVNDTPSDAVDPSGMQPPPKAGQPLALTPGNYQPISAQEFWDLADSLGVTKGFSRGSPPYNRAIGEAAEQLVLILMLETKNKRAFPTGRTRQSHLTVIPELALPIPIMSTKGEKILLKDSYFMDVKLVKGKISITHEDCQIQGYLYRLGNFSQAAQRGLPPVLHLVTASDTVIDEKIINYASNRWTLVAQSKLEYDSTLKRFRVGRPEILNALALRRLIRRHGIPLFGGPSILTVSEKLMKKSNP